MPSHLHLDRTVLQRLNNMVQYFQWFALINGIDGGVEHTFYANMGLATITYDFATETTGPSIFTP